MDTEQIERKLDERGVYFDCDNEHPRWTYVIAYADGSIRAGRVGAVKAMVDDENSGHDVAQASVFVNNGGRLFPVRFKTTDNPSGSDFTHYQLVADFGGLDDFILFTNF